MHRIAKEVEYLHRIAKEMEYLHRIAKEMEYSAQDDYRKWISCTG